jgi:hypothetical protein
MNCGELRDAVSARVAERLSKLVGFSLGIDISPEENFAWKLRLTGTWFPLSHASSAIRRWVYLAGNETLREILLVADSASQFHEGTLSAEEFLAGVVPQICSPIRC